MTLEDRTLVRMPHQDREGQAEAVRGPRVRPNFSGAEVCDFMGFGVKQWVAAGGCCVTLET